MVCTHGLPPDIRGGVHLLIPPYAIGSVPGLSGHAIAYRWRSLPTGRRYRASKHQGSSERVLAWQITKDQLICASLSRVITKRFSQQTVTNVHRAKPTEVEVTKALKVMTNRNAGGVVVVVVFFCFFFSHSAHWLPTRKKLL